jgi:hypothetical protein
MYLLYKIWESIKQTQAPPKKRKFEHF